MKIDLKKNLQIYGYLDALSIAIVFLILVKVRLMKFQWLVIAKWCDIDKYGLCLSILLDINETGQDWILHLIVRINVFDDESQHFDEIMKIFDEELMFYEVSMFFDDEQVTLMFFWWRTDDIDEEQMMLMEKIWCWWRIEERSRWMNNRCCWWRTNERFRKTACL